MAHELVVALHVIDAAAYQAYRDAMAPLPRSDRISSAIRRARCGG